MTLAYDEYLHKRKLKPGGFFGFHEYESFEDYKSRLSRNRLMPPAFRGRLMRRTRPYRFTRRSFRRRFPSKRLRVARKGFIPRYKKVAFVGHKFGTRQLLKCIESKRFITYDRNPITLTHTLNSDLQWLFAPMEGMTQGTARDQFNNSCIWVRGISYKCYFSPVSTDNDSYHIRFMVVKTKSVTDFRSSAWTETADADTNADHFMLDVDYNVTTERELLIASPNRNAANKVLYDKVIHINNTNTAAGSNQRFFKLWLPLNHLHRFQTDIDFNLGVAPNFGQFGDIAFVLMWDNGSHMAGGTKKSLVIAGQEAIVYFRDG